MGNPLAGKTMNPNSGSLDGYGLGSLFEKIVRSWGADDVLVLGTALVETEDLPLERSLILSGSLKGLVNIRCSPEFPAWLRDHRQGTPLGRYPAEEVFEELVSFFCLSLFHRFWRPHSFQIGPIHPFDSQPEFWPLDPPNASCALLVEGYRVELRFWTND